MYELQGALKQRIEDVRARYPRVGLAPLQQYQQMHDHRAHGTPREVGPSPRVYEGRARDAPGAMRISSWQTTDLPQPLKIDLKDCRPPPPRGIRERVATALLPSSINLFPPNNSPNLHNPPRTSPAFLLPATHFSACSRSSIRHALRCRRQSSMCREAQIRVAMVTGDHPATATAIAYQCGILSKEITEQNGLDSIRLVEDEMSRPCADILRNGVVMS